MFELRQAISKEARARGLLLVGLPSEGIPPSPDREAQGDYETGRPRWPVGASTSLGPPGLARLVSVAVGVATAGARGRLAEVAATLARRR